MLSGHNAGVVIKTSALCLGGPESKPQIIHWLSSKCDFRFPGG